MNCNYTQATGLKGEIVTEHAAKRPKTSMTTDVAKLTSPQSSDADPGMTSLHAEATTDRNKQLVSTVSQSPKASTTMRVLEPTGLKQPIQPFVPVNRYKLDNRPTAFRIITPLPAGLANVSILFSHSVSTYLEKVSHHRLNFYLSNSLVCNIEIGGEKPNMTCCFSATCYTA